VHSVAFSPSGDALAFAAHDSSVTIVYPSAPEQPPHAIVTVTTQMLPFMSLIWTKEDQIVAAGHDCHPLVFQGDQNGWRLTYIVDDPNKAQKESSHDSSALNMFRQMDLKGRTSTVDDTSLKTIHQNTISYVVSSSAM
jgi:actin related protein 2/3 complex subunit 1A/1B